MSEQLHLRMLDMAERWAEAVGTSLRSRRQFTATVFTVTRRLEERALLAAAVEVYDLVAATPDGRALLVQLGLDADPDAPESLEAMAQRWADWCATRRVHSPTRGEVL